ncbi:MAG: hypothetical protein JNM83_26720, partial [Myxococcales bacterium]|nr:hypothetical protein [Myxococcales bacterium]
AHDQESPDEPFAPPSLAELARILTEAGYKTPRGKDKWWPAQVQQVMDGKFEGYYVAKSGLADGGMKGLGSVVGPWGCS